MEQSPDSPAKRMPRKTIFVPLNGRHVELGVMNSSQNVSCNTICSLSEQRPTRQQQPKNELADLFIPPCPSLASILRGSRWDTQYCSNRNKRTMGSYCRCDFSPVYLNFKQNMDKNRTTRTSSVVDKARICAKPACLSNICAGRLAAFVFP